MSEQEKREYELLSRLDREQREYMLQNGLLEMRENGQRCWYVMPEFEPDISEPADWDEAQYQAEYLAEMERMASGEVH